MNTKIKLFFILFTCICIGMVSCSDDEKTDYAKEITGKYKGAITNEGAPLASNVEIDITHKSENKVLLKLNHDFGMIKIDIECESSVIYSKDLYVVSGNTSFSSPPAVPEETQVTVIGTIDREGKAILNMDISALQMNIVFSGTKEK